MVAEYIWISSIIGVLKHGSETCAYYKHPFVWSMCVCVRGTICFHILFRSVFTFWLFMSTDMSDIFKLFGIESSIITWSGEFHSGYMVVKPSILSQDPSAWRGTVRACSVRYLRVNAQKKVQSFWVLEWWNGKMVMNGLYILILYIYINNIYKIYNIT